MDGEHSGEVTRGGSPGPSSILRSVGMDHHHPRVHAIGHILSVPLGHMLVRDMEDVLQMQIEQHGPHPLLNSPPPPETLLIETFYRVEQCNI